MHLDHLPLNALRAVEAAGRLGSFRAAAEEMGVTQGAVAQQVRGLEDRLEVALFDRHPRGVALTEAGQRMCDRLKNAFRQMEDAVADLRDHEDVVRLALPGDLAAGWLEPRRDDLIRACPGVVLEVIAPEDGKSDLLLTAGEPPRGMMAVSAGLFLSEIVAVAKPGVLAEGRGFAGVHLLHDSRDLWPTFIEEVMGMERPIRLGGLQLGDPEAALAAALAGQGVALAERRAVGRALSDGRLERVDPGALRSGRAFRLSGGVQGLSRPAIRSVVDWIVRQAAIDSGRAHVTADARG